MVLSIIYTLMMIQQQQPDRQKLYLQGSCKFPNVPWTDAELKELTKDGGWNAELVKKLRSDHIKEHEDDFTDPKGKAKNVVETVEAPALESTEVSTEPEITTTSTVETVEAPTTSSLEEKKEEFKRLYGKSPAGKYANDEKWLATKIAEAGK